MAKWYGDDSARRSDEQFEKEQARIRSGYRKGAKPYESPRITSKGAMTPAAIRQRGRGFLISPSALGKRKVPGPVSPERLASGPGFSKQQALQARLTREAILERLKRTPARPKEKAGPVSFTPRKLGERPGGRGVGVETEFGRSPQTEVGGFQSDQAAVYSKVIDELKKTIQASNDPRVRQQLDERALDRRKAANAQAREDLAEQEALEPKKDPYASVPEDFLTEEDIDNRLKRAQATIPAGETEESVAARQKAEQDAAAEAFWAKKAIGKRKKLEDVYLGKIPGESDFKEVDKFLVEQPRIGAHHVADFLYGSEPARPVSKGVLGTGVIGTPMEAFKPDTGGEDLPEGMEEPVEGYESPHDIQRREYLAQFGSPLEQYLQERGKDTAAAAESLGRRSPLPPALQFAGRPTGVAGKTMFAPSIGPTILELRKTQKALKDHPKAPQLLQHRNNLVAKLKALAQTGAVPTSPSAFRARLPERAPKSEVERLKELPPGTSKDKVVRTLLPLRTTDLSEIIKKNVTKFKDRRDTRRKKAKSNG